MNLLYNNLNCQLTECNFVVYFAKFLTRSHALTTAENLMLFDVIKCVALNLVVKIKYIIFRLAKPM